MPYQTLFLSVFLSTGFLAAGSAFYGRYRVLPAFLTGPNICQSEAGGCQTLFRTPRAALWGIPNSMLGLAYYPLLAAGWIFGLPNWLLFTAACIALVLSMQLVRILVRDRLECRICWIGHTSNGAIWLMLLLSLRGNT